MEALAAASSCCILRRRPSVSTACSTPAWPSLLHPLRPPGTGSAPAPPLYPQQPRALLRAASGGKGVWATSRPAPPLTRGSAGLERRTRFYFIHSSSLQERDRKAGQGASSSRGGETSLRPPRRGAHGPVVGGRGGGAGGKMAGSPAAPSLPEAAAPVAGGGGGRLRARRACRGCACGTRRSPRPPAPAGRQSPLRPRGDSAILCLPPRSRRRP